MSIRFFHPPHLPAPGGHYTPAIRAGDFVWVAGQTPRDKERCVVGSGIAEQTTATLMNLRAVLEGAGATLGHVVKTTVFLENLSDAAEFNRIYQGFFPGNPPVRTLAGARLNGVLVEIDAIAYVGNNAPMAAP